MSVIDRIATAFEQDLKGRDMWEPLAEGAEEEIRTEWREMLVAILEWEESKPVPRATRHVVIECCAPVCIEDRTPCNGAWVPITWCIDNCYWVRARNQGVEKV